MAATGTAALSAEVQTLFDADFYLASQSMVYWDQFADLRIQMDGQRGKTYEFPIVESNQPSAGTLNELEDVVPQQMRANAISVTLNEYGGAIEVTTFVVATSYSDPHEQAAYVNGYNLAESVDFVARAVAGQGSRIFYQNNRTARADFDGIDVAADRITPEFLQLLAIFARATKMPLYEDGSLCTVIPPFLLYDLLTNADIKTLATRQTPEMLFNGEVAYYGGVRIIVAPSAKAFWGEGAAQNGATTLSAAAAVGDATLSVVDATNLVVGEWVAIRDAGESGNTWSDTNETFRITSKAGNNITGFALDPGPGDAGGVRYAHPTGTVVRDNNSVYPIVCLGPNSVTKAASDITGPYGVSVIAGPFDRLGRFLSFGWYLIGGYARTRNGWLLRGECGSSQS